MGVLDEDGDDLSGVGAADPEPFAGDHDDAVAGDLALDADRSGGRRGSRVVAMRAAGVDGHTAASIAIWTGVEEFLDAVPR
jgi:hypothetical protein